VFVEKKLDVLKNSGYTFDVDYNACWRVASKGKREKRSHGTLCLRNGLQTSVWKDDKIIVVYNDKQFELDKNDESTWKEAVEHGKKQGIPEEDLDFRTD
jgi:hypothetical protein